MLTLTSFRRAAPWVVGGFFLALLVVAAGRHELGDPATPTELARAIHKLQATTPREVAPGTVLRRVSLDGGVIVFAIVLVEFRGIESISPRLRNDLRESVLSEVRANRTLVALTRRYDLQVRYEYSTVDGLPIASVDIHPGDLGS